MKRWLTLVVFGLAACAPLVSSPSTGLNTEMPSPALPDYGPAPEFTNTVWLNTDKPLTLADLRGKVVAVEMWTFG